MGYYLGIDLGSTTTKAVVMDDERKIIGRGITNTRSNYSVATQVAGNEAMNRANFFLLRRSAGGDGGADASNGDADGPTELFSALESEFRYIQQIEKFRYLKEKCLDLAEDPKLGERRAAIRDALGAIFEDMDARSGELFSVDSMHLSQFFRDIVGSEYLRLADERGKALGAGFEDLMGIYDKSIIQVENRLFESRFYKNVKEALERIAVKLGPGEKETLKKVRRMVEDPEIVPRGGGAPTAQEGAYTDGLPIENTVGTGYGRQQLPFEKDQIRSEILCHGLGAHYMFPGTSTVLDIGGQDTKAIQVDQNGIVKSFQMNDRCAAGCGRYLGYIADELNMGLHQLGPLSLKATRTVRINSTCTVFAGAELRDRLSLGESRENILAGLHRAIILRAMSLLARSGGVFNEFTFTGGVAKNAAVVKSLKELVDEHYGVHEVNIHPDSIYTGAVGAALFALEG